MLTTTSTIKTKVDDPSRTNQKLKGQKTERGKDQIQSRMMEYNN